MRMKFLRIFPEMCARTTCLFSSSTLNMAFGSVSTTVPTTSIASSFGIGTLDLRSSLQTAYAAILLLFLHDCLQGLENVVNGLLSVDFIVTAPRLVVLNQGLSHRMIDLQPFLDNLDRIVLPVHEARVALIAAFVLQARA